MAQQAAQEIASRLRHSLSLLHAEQPSLLLAAGEDQPTIAEAGGQLKRTAATLSLLLTTNELPSWQSVEGAALAARFVREASSLCALAAVRALGGCIVYRQAISSAVENVVNSLAQLVCAAGSDRDEVVSLTAACLECCDALEGLPRDGRASTGRALLALGAAVKDAQRESDTMLRPAGEAVAQELGSEDDESCDFTEAATDAEQHVIRAAQPLLRASLAVLAPLLRCVSHADVSLPPAFLDGALSAYRRLSDAVECLTAALWPPQEPAGELRALCAAVADAALALPEAARDGMPSAALACAGLAGALDAEAEAVAQAARACDVVLAEVEADD